MCSLLALFTALDFLVQLLHHEDEVIFGNTALCLSHCVGMSKWNKWISHHDERSSFLFPRLTVEAGHSRALLPSDVIVLAMLRAKRLLVKKVILLPRTQARCSGFVIESDWSDYGQRLLHHRSKFTRSIACYSLIARSCVFLSNTWDT